MGAVTLIGIDLGKHCFFLHAQDSHGHEAWRKKFTGQRLTSVANYPTCTVVMKTCAGAHWLARILNCLIRALHGPPGAPCPAPCIGKTAATARLRSAFCARSGRYKQTRKQVGAATRSNHNVTSV